MRFESLILSCAIAKDVLLTTTALRGSTNFSGNPTASSKRVYSYDGDDYPGADEGILIALPQRPVGTLTPYEGVADKNEESNPQVWSMPSQIIPYYEWMIAQSRGNRYAFPEPTVQMLEQLERILNEFEQGVKKEVPVERRKLLDNGESLGAFGAAQAAANSLSQNAGEGVSNMGSSTSDGMPSMNADSMNSLINAISKSMSNVAAVAGQAVGVTTTPPPPLNQAILGLLSILQGFQKLALAAGSLNIDGASSV